VGLTFYDDDVTWFFSPRAEGRHRFSSSRSASQLDRMRGSFH